MLKVTQVNYITSDCAMTDFIDQKVKNMNCVNEGCPFSVNITI